MTDRKINPDPLFAGPAGGTATRLCKRPELARERLAAVAKPRRKTIRPGLIESLVRSIAEGLVDPKMQGPNFSWLETFPSLGARLTEGQLGLGYFKVHPHHLEEIKQKAQEVAEEYARRQPGGRPPTRRYLFPST